MDKNANRMLTGHERIRVGKREAAFDAQKN